MESVRSETHIRNEQSPERRELNDIDERVRDAALTSIHQYLKSASVDQLEQLIWTQLVQAPTQGEAQKAFEGYAAMKEATGAVVEPPPLTYDTPDLEGDFPLIQAAQEGLIEDVQKMLEGGADPYVENPKGQNAFQAAQQAGDHQIAMLVHWYMLNLGPRAFGALLRDKIAEGDRDAVQDLLAAEAPVHQPNAMGEQAIHLAARLGDCIIMEMVLNHTFDVDARTVSGRSTALHIAVEARNWGCVQLLLSEGADVRCVDEYARTPRAISLKLPVVKDRPQDSFGSNTFKRSRDWEVHLSKPEVVAHSVSLVDEEEDMGVPSSVPTTPVHSKRRTEEGVVWNEKSLTSPYGRTVSGARILVPKTPSPLALVKKKRSTPRGNIKTCRKLDMSSPGKKGEVAREPYLFKSAAQLMGEADRG